MKRLWAALPVLLLVAATIGCDRVTKHVAATTLSGSPGRSFLGNLVQLEYAENTGAFLGLGAQWHPVVRLGLFTIGNGVVLLAVAVLAIRRPWSPVSLIGLALLFAGGASNLADRALHGSVIDFMKVGLGPLRTGIFNVADVAIMAGVGLVVLSTYRPRESRHRAH
jgi:signal peptidase II